MEEFKIPAEFIGLGGGSTMLAVVIYFLNKFLKRWTDAQDKLAEAMTALAAASVEHNTSSVFFQVELKELRRESIGHTKALAILVERTSHPVGSGDA